MNSQVDVDDLLTKLMAAGIINKDESKSEVKAEVKAEVKEEKEVNEKPVVSNCSTVLKYVFTRSNILASPFVYVPGSQWRAKKLGGLRNHHLCNIGGLNHKMVVHLLKNHTFE